MASPPRMGAPPARSGLRDVRRLLRRLDDPVAVRANPFVAHIIAGANDDDAVRSRVRKCVEDAAARLLEDVSDATTREQQRRRHAILLRHDVGREPWSKVAADLGVSRSQFFRDRRAACEFVRDSIERRFGASMNRIETISTDSSTLDLAVRLGNLGQIAQAVVVYDELIAHADGERAVSLLALRTRLLAEASHVSDAVSSRDTMRDRMATVACSLSTGLEVALADAATHAALAERCAAEAACRAVLATAASAAHAGCAEIEIEAEVLLAKLLWERHDLGGARSALTRARRGLEVLGYATPQIEAAFACANFYVHYLASDFAGCARAFAYAEDSLIAAGQIRRFVIVEAAYAVLKRRQGDADAARHHAGRAAILAHPVIPPEEVAVHLTQLAAAASALRRGGASEAEGYDVLEFWLGPLL